MTASDTRETVAFAMWKHEALRAAPNVGKKRTPEAFADASDADRSKWLGLADAAIAAIPAMQVAVKPLEWVYDEMRGVWSAQDGFGRHYTVSDSQWFHGGLSEFIWVDGGDEAAKAAAQADYEARIRSSLTAQPSPDVAAMVEAISPLVAIADAFDANELDNEARKFWGQHSVNTMPHENIVLYSGRGGKEMLTLADCMKARATLARVKGGAA